MKRLVPRSSLFPVRCPLSSIPPALVLSFLLILACTRVPGEKETQTLERASLYMIKDSILHDQFEVTHRGLEVYDTFGVGPDRTPEAVIYWEEVALLRKMVYAWPIDSVLHHYKTKGETHWDTTRFAHLPTPPQPLKPNKNADKPLAGLRVALDPGHVGGAMDYAQFMEEKYVRIKPDPANGITEEIAFCEGNLALGTALVLAEKLRSMGAEVMLTREKEGLNAFGITFEQWLAREIDEFKARERGRANGGRMDDNADRPLSLDDPAKPGYELPDVNGYTVDYAIRAASANYIRRFHITGKDSTWWMTKPTLAHVHRLPFLKVEFLERARLIQAFRPHVTLIIHYNVGGNNPSNAEGYRKALPENYCMAFIPGAFMKGELKEPEDRLAFAANLLTDDLTGSQRLSHHIVQAHVRKLGVPVMTWDDKLAYLKNASLRTPEIGVFSRNLQLTRLVHTTLCFGESLYQDNRTEAVRLNARDFTLPGMTTPLPNRIKDVADAYLEGLMAWLEEQ
jgi:N-acetylmuramoyl-L-alanine amidase